MYAKRWADLSKIGRPVSRSRSLPDTLPIRVLRSGRLGWRHKAKPVDRGPGRPSTKGHSHWARGQIERIRRFAYWAQGVQRTDSGSAGNAEPGGIWPEDPADAKLGGFVSPQDPGHNHGAPCRDIGTSMDAPPVGVAELIDGHPPDIIAPLRVYLDGYLFRGLEPFYEMVEGLAARPRKQQIPNQGP